MATGRTHQKFVKVQIDDSGGTLRDIPVNTIGDVGLTSEAQDQTAWQDLIMSSMVGLPSFETTIGGPFSNLAAASASGSGAAPTLSGSHTVLAGINNANTPLTFGVYVGIQDNWSSGDPAFGLTSSATVGFLLHDYLVNLDTMTYTAKIVLFAGSSAPAWGTAVFT